MFKVAFEEWIVQDDCGFKKSLVELFETVEEGMGEEGTFLGYVGKKIFE